VVVVVVVARVRIRDLDQTLKKWIENKTENKKNKKKVN